MTNHVGRRSSNVRATLHSTLVHRDNLLHHRLLNDLNGLDDCLHVLHLLHDFIRYLLMAYALSDHYLLYRVGLLHVHNLLHRARDVLDVLHGYLPRDRHLHNLLNDLLNRIRAVPITDLLHRHLHFVGLGNLYLVRLRHLPVDITNYFLGHRAWYRAVNHLGHFVGHLNVLGHLNAMRNFHAALHNLLHGIRLGDLHNLVHRVRFGNVDAFLDRIRARNLLTDLHLVRAVNPAFNNLLNRIRHWSVDRLLHGIRHTAFHDLFDRVRAWSVDTLLHRVGNLHVLRYLLLHGVRALHNLFTDLLDRDWAVHGTGNLAGYRHINRAANFVWNGHLNTNRLRNLTSNVAHTLDNTIYRYVYDLLDSLFDWDWDGTLDNLFNRVRALNTFNHRAVVGLLNTLRHELLDWIRARNLDDLLHGVGYGNIDDLVDRVRHRAVIWLGNGYIVRLRAVNSADHFVGHGAVHSTYVFNLLHYVNVPSFSGIPASLGLRAARHLSGD